MKISSKVVFIIFGLIILSVIAFVLIPADESEEEQGSAYADVDYNKLDEVVFNVSTELVIKGNLVKTISANGVVKAFNELDVVTNISGYIDEINIFEGSQVDEGQLLVKLDDREHQIALREAEVNVSNARIEYGFLSKEVAISNTNTAGDSLNDLVFKLENDFKEGRINEKEFLDKKEDLDLALIFTGAKRDEVMLNKSGLTNAINAINRARLNLSYTAIFSAFKGVVADAHIVKKGRVNAGEKIFKLLDISSFKIEVGVLENEIAMLKVGCKAEVQLNALPGEKYSGKIIYINPLIDNETKTCRVTIQIPNTDHNIKPGMFATVNIESEILKNRVLIPRKALLVRDNRSLVFAAENDEGNNGQTLAKWHYVQTGEQNDMYIEILGGILPGEKIITNGHYNLAHDAKIRITE